MVLPLACNRVGRRSARPFAFLVTLAVTLAAPVSLRAEIVDQKSIHKEYQDGEFDRAAKELEAFRRRNGVYTRDDSIFIAKHLAVIYAANPRTREKGRYFMFQLLELMPSAKLVDMFVGEEINRIFAKVEEEFEAKRSIAGPARDPDLEPGEEFRTEPFPVPVPARAPAGPVAAPAGKSSRAKYWVMGGLGVAAAGTAAFLVLDANRQPPADKVYPVAK